MAPLAVFRMTLHRLLSLFIVARACRTALSSSSSAPWQSNSGTSVMDQEQYRDGPANVFAPGGRLYSVEHTVAAATSKEDESSNLVVALSCKDGVVIVSTLPTSPHLHVANLVAHHGALPFVRLSADMWAVTGGNAIDSRILQYKISRIAEAMQEEYDGGQPLPASPVTSAFLARRLADHLQVPTQTIGTADRMLASFALIAEGDNCLWRVDPTGQFWKCHAAAIGRGAGAAESHLLDLCESRDLLFFTKMSAKEAVATACECIRKALPKEPESHWQALLLRRGQQSRVWNATNAQEMLNSTKDDALDSLSDEPL